MSVSRTVSETFESLGTVSYWHFLWHRNIVIPFGTEKLEWRGYPTVKKRLIKIYLAVSTEYRRVTDGRTERQTDK